MKLNTGWIVIAVLVLAAIALPAAAAEPTIVVIDFALQDDMQPAPGTPAPGAEAVQRRTRDLGEYFRRLAAESTRYELVALDRDAPAYRRLQQSSGRLFQCKHCIVAFGREIGADYVLHGWVQRVSNLIINMNVEILEVASGRVLDRASVDTRGNTDKSWLDGASYLSRHMLLGL